MSIKLYVLLYSLPAMMISFTKTRLMDVQKTFLKIWKKNTLTFEEVLSNVGHHAKNRTVYKWDYWIDMERCWYEQKRNLHKPPNTIQKNKGWNETVCKKTKTSAGNRVIPMTDTGILFSFPIWLESVWTIPVSEEWWKQLLKWMMSEQYNFHM